MLRQGNVRRIVRGEVVAWRGSDWKCVKETLAQRESTIPVQKEIMADASTTTIKLLVAFLALLAKDIRGGHP